MNETAVKPGRYSQISGQRFRKVRESAKEKQFVVARTAKMNPAHLSDIERGAVAITFEAAERLINALESLGADTSELCNERVDDHWVAV